MLLELGNSLTAPAAKAFVFSCNDRNALTRIRNKIYFLCKTRLLSFHDFRIYSITCRWLSQRSGTSGKLGFSQFPYLNGNRQCEFRFPQFGARRRGGYGLLLLMATKRLIETMSGYMKDKLAALTAPMANAYANAVVFNKIENLVATFRHRKSTKTSSRFLFLNIKGNDKSYQTP